jgi:hypothetical protein
MSNVLSKVLGDAKIVLKLTLQNNVGAVATRDAIIKMFESRDSVPGRRASNMELIGAEPDAAAITEDSDRFKELCDGLRDTLDWQCNAQAKWLSFVANAKLAKTHDTQTDFQRDCLVIKVELEKYVTMLSAAAAMCVPREPGPTDKQEFPHDFPQELLKLVGVTVDEHSHKFVEFTLEQYADTEAHLNYSCWIAGEAGGGKGVLTRALGRKFCRMYGKPRYVYTQNVDPLGITTKAGEMGSMGAFVFADMVMKTLMNTRLEDEHLKALFGVYETTAVPGRYHQVIFPKDVPRMFSCQVGKRTNTGCDAGVYFDREGLPGLAALARRDEDELAMLSDDDIAMARRSIVWVIPDTKFIGVKKEAITRDKRSIVEAALAAERSYYASGAK